MGQLILGNFKKKLVFLHSFVKEAPFKSAGKESYYFIHCGLQAQFLAYFHRVS